MSTPWHEEKCENYCKKKLENLQRGDKAVAWRMAEIWMNSIKLASLMDRIYS